MARKNPYTALKDRAFEWAAKVTSPRTRQDVHWPGARTCGDTNLREMWIRADAADTIGYDAVLRADNKTGALHLVFVERRPDAVPRFLLW